MERNEIQEKYKWNTADIFVDDDAWEKAFAELETQIDFSAYRNTLNSVENVLTLCIARDKVLDKMNRLYLYASMKHDEDVRVTKYAAYDSKIMALYSKLMTELAFAEPELTALPTETLISFSKDERLKDYDYMLEQLIKSKAHVLSAAEERILALSSEAVSASSKIFGMLDNADLNLAKASFNGEETQITHGMYGLVLHNGTREEREEWFKKYYEAYIKISNTLAETYSANVKKDVFFKTARNYDSCLQMALSGSDVQPEVYNNLVKTVHDALPLMHRYISLRKQVLGFEEQHMYDIYTPLVEDCDIKMSYDDAYELVVKGLAPLGEEYQELLKKAHDERWIDVYENTGKRSGAYSTGVYGTHPFVLLNYQETTNDIFTIAHEMGHSIHTYKSSAAQPFSKADYTLFVAEIASTCNEVLLLKHLYNNTTDVKLKKYLLNYYMDMIRATLFRQTQFAEFEQIVHERAEKGEPLTKELLCDIYYQLNKDYYGDGIVHDSEIAYEWSRIPHFYRSFYVYQYSTGIISAISIAKRILSMGDKAVEDYFAFLSTGGSMSPVEELKKAGVDLMTQEPFHVAMQEFEDTLNEFESLCR